MRRVIAATATAAAAATASFTSASYVDNAKQVRQQGHTTITNLLTEKERAVLLRHTRRRPDLNSLELDALPPTAQPTKGRLHCELTSTFHRFWTRSDDKTRSEIKNAVLSVEGKTVEFAKIFFGQERFRLTQLQLLDSEANSAAQFWHVDNTTEGLTFVIALEDITLRDGPTELLLGTQHVHNPRDGSFSLSNAYNMLQAATTEHDRTVTWQRAVVDKNGAFIFDSRIWHRGGANISKKSRPVMIVRYDLSNFSPPGMGVVGTSILRSVGRLLESSIVSKK
jgi:hypothetical protein